MSSFFVWVWDVDPRLFQVKNFLGIGNLTIHWYGLFFVLGIVLTYTFSRRVLKQWGGDPQLIEDFTVPGVIAVLIGARLVHVFFYDFDAFLKHPQFLFHIWRGGLASHGGILGVGLATYWFCRRKKISFYTLADPICIYASFIYIFVRLGNLFNSEIVGSISDVPWGVRLLRYDPLHVRHPAQIYEMLMGVITLTILVLLSRRYKRWVPGSYFWLEIFLFFLLRIFVEYFKEYQAFSPGAPFTMGQLLSVVPLVWAGGWLFRNRKALLAYQPAAS